MMKIKLRVLVASVAITLLTVLAPHGLPFSPSTVAAADTWSNRTVTWWMDDSTDTKDGSGIYRVKMALSWQTTDPHPVCYLRGAAAPDGTGQQAYLPDNVPACHVQGVAAISHFWYPSRNFSVQCWVSQSVVLSVLIDYCGKMADQQNYAPYWFVYGSIFRTCLGIVNTPFSICTGFKSKLTVLGASIGVWNSAS